MTTPHTDTTARGGPTGIEYGLLDAALTADPPPVVARAVADRLAEALERTTSVFTRHSGRYYETMGEDNPRLTALAEAIAASTAALAKYKEATE